MSLTDPVPSPLTDPATLLATEEGAAGGPQLLGDRHGHLLRGSAWLVATLAVGAVSGVVFWLVAARLDTTATVGRAAALFTSVLVVNYATSMGLPIAVARYSPDSSPASRVLFSWALVYTALTSGIGTLIFVALVPDSVVAPLWEWGRPIGVALFFLVVTGTSFAILVDVRLMAMRRLGWLLGRTLLVAVVRIPLLWARPVGNDALWLFLLVAGLPALAGFLATVLLPGPGRRPLELMPIPEEAGRALRYASVNYVSMLASQAPQFVLPLIVLLNVSPSTNASFYVAWSITTLVFLVPQAIGQVLLVEGGRGDSQLVSQVKLGLAITLALTVVISIACYLFSDLVTAFYGNRYESAARLLPTLVGASIAWAVTSILLTEARIREESLSTVLITLTFGLVILVPAAAFTAEEGVYGAATSWLVGNVVAAAVAAVMFGRAQRRLTGTSLVAPR